MLDLWFIHLCQMLYIVNLQSAIRCFNSCWLNWQGAEVAPTNLGEFPYSVDTEFYRDTVTQLFYVAV